MIAPFIKFNFIIVLAVARDNGSPAKQTPRDLTILIEDLDDNLPQFPKYQNCCIRPYNFSVMENLQPGLDIGMYI